MESSARWLTRIICMGLFSLLVFAGCTDDNAKARPAKSISTRSSAITGGPRLLSDFIVYSTEETQIRDRVASSEGMIGSAGYVEIGAEAEISGSIESGGDAFLRSGASISGDVAAGGGIDKQDQVVVSGSETPYTAVPAVAIPFKSMS